MAKTYSLFISHSWDHDDTLQSLKNLLNGRGYFSAVYTQVEKNCPINSEKAAVVKANITKRLQESDVLLAIAGVLHHIVSGCNGRWIRQKSLVSML